MSTLQNETRKTPLHEIHLQSGGQMVDFAGWDMPVQYKETGLVAEHLATRNACGLFDVSHMGEVIVEGEGALAEVDRLVSNDITRLETGDAAYALLCHEDGGTVDDLYVYRLGEERFLLVVNAANTDKDYAHMLRHARKPELFSNRSDNFAQIALQGPKASEILSQVAPGDAIGLPRNKVRIHDFHGANLLVATTGYTGERGFEIYTPPEIAADLWRALMTAGDEYGLKAVGLGARDTLRLEVAYPLYGHELGDDINGYEARVGWAIKLNAGDFLGRAALQTIRRDKVKRRLVGLEMIDRGIPRAGYSVLHTGETVGTITSGTQAPSLKRPIAIAMVPKALSKKDTILEVDLRGRPRKARVIALPFWVKD